MGLTDLISIFDTNTEFHLLDVYDVEVFVGNADDARVFLGKNEQYFVNLNNGGIWVRASGKDQIIIYMDERGMD